MRKIPKTGNMLRDEAAAWYGLLRGGRSLDTDAEFQRWYCADPRNADAFDKLCGTHWRFGSFRQSRNYQPKTAERIWQNDHAGPRYAWAIAACLALIAMAVILTAGNPLVVSGSEAVMLKTNIGEIRKVNLSDGSKVTLDTSTRVEVEIGRSHRRARVKYGRARFEIAAAAQPFIIEVGDDAVTASQGTLDVQQQEERSRVGVVSGTAQLQTEKGPSARTLTLGPREGAANTGRSISTFEVPQGPDWTRGMLQFAGTPLNDAVVLANRYSDQRILLDDDFTGLRVTGAFRAGDNAGLARALGAAFKLSAEQSADGNWHLARQNRLQSRN